MKKEKEIIESQGFEEWDKREFQKFVQALEIFASDDYESISKYMDSTKSPDEVRDYARVFFLKVHSLNNS